MQRDITLIVLFAVMIFLFLCNFMSLGIVGDTLSRVMFGLCGFAGYFLPVFIFGVYLFYVLEADRDPKAGAKTAAIVGLFIIFMVFAHLLSGDLENTTGYDPGSMWKNSAENKNAGGVLGGTLAYILYRLLKTFGAVLVLLVAAIGCIYVIGQRSFLELFRDKAMDAKLAHEERLEQREEEARYRREHPEEFEDPEEEEPADDWNNEDSQRSHYEETRERYQELRRERRAREAAANAERSVRMSAANTENSNASGSTNVVITDDGQEDAEPEAELDAPSIRSGQMDGVSRKKVKVHHFRGIVGDTALTDDRAYEDSDSQESQSAFPMPSDAVIHREEEADSGDVAPSDPDDTEDGPSAEPVPDEREDLRDSDELHEILPEDFLDEEEEENPESVPQTNGVPYSHGGTASSQNPIPATIIRPDEDGQDAAVTDGENGQGPAVSPEKEEENLHSGTTEETDSFPYEQKPEEAEAGDPYSDMPDIHVISSDQDAEGGDEASGRDVPEESPYSETEPQDEGISAADPAEDTGAIAIHTEREAGPSEVTQALKENTVYDSAEGSPVTGAHAETDVTASENASETGRTPAPAPAAAAVKHEYVFPPISLLHPGKKSATDSDAELRHTAQTLQTTLENFGVKVTITDISQGPAVTRYEMLPEMGVKVSKIVSLADDIKLALAATDIRIEAPIPGKSAIGIEVPNKEAQPVALRDIIDTDEFRAQKSKIAFAVGKDIAGKPVYGDIAKMPHVLIAGATGSGKSVCINTIIMSILYHAKPDEVKLIMIDPKVVELSVYNGIPHLLIPVVTNPQKAAAALNWGVAEMEARYRHFADAKVRDIKAYNQKAREAEKSGDNPDGLHFMPQIVIIVDELADLMMVAKNDVETAICRLAQLARAAGIYLIIATQRPSVDVITGLIKANMPSRIAFRVTSGVDSRTILDMNGAEKLLGKGDMLFFPQGLPKPTRVQGCFVSDEEVNDVVQFVIDNNPITDEDSKKHQAEIDAIESGAESGAGSGSASGAAEAEPEQDELFGAAGAFIIEKNNASIGLLQRRYRIGFNRAARIMDQLCDAGVVSDSEGTKSRNILMTMEQFLTFCHDSGIPVPDTV